MLTLPSAVRICLCTQVTDMRRSFDTLAERVRRVIGQDPASGHLFLFRSRRGDRLKVLYWDRDGYALWYKRLERGTFCMPTPAADGRLEARELAMMLEGLEPAGVRRRPRFARPERA